MGSGVMSPSSSIIWSADLNDEKELLATLENMPRLQIVKIDRLLTTKFGLGLIDRVQEMGKQVFDDAKIIEIPSKLVAIADEHLKHRPFMLNCMAGGVSSRDYTSPDSDKIDGLKRFADACHKVGTKPCGVTVLTSKADEVVQQEFGRTAADQVLYYVELLLECGFTDVVCSPKEVKMIRSESRFNSLSLNTPGVRPAGSESQDQARVGTIEMAITEGADRLVLGRPLTQGNPAENFRAISQVVRQAYSLKLLGQLGAILANDHFVYTSGKHGSAYVNKDEVFTDPVVANQICFFIADMIQEAGLDVDVVLGPVAGAVAYAELVALHLGRGVKAGYADKKDDGFAIRSTFAKHVKGKRVFIVEDILTTGGSVAEVVKETRNEGGEVVGVGAICNRGGVTAEQIKSPALFSVTEVSLDAHDATPESPCPLCKEGKPINTKIGHGAKYVEEHGQPQVA